MADIRTCRNCRRMFTDYTNRRLCPDCAKIEDEAFDKVKEYIRDNPDATITSTAKECDVSENLIRQWLKEERLEYKNAEMAGLRCEKCGAPITSGRHCQKCRSSLYRELGAVLRAEEKPVELPKPSAGGSKMRFLGK